MNNTALREDIYNPKVIFNFVTIINSMELLDMLYIITYADMSAVAPNIYNSFSSKLLKELHHKAIFALDNKELITEAKARINREKNLQKVEQFIELNKSLQKKILSITSNLFFLKYKNDEIIEIAKRVIQTKDINFVYENIDNLSIEIIAKVEINIGWLLGKLSYMDVVNMDIFKLFDGAKYFKISFTPKVDESDIHTIESFIMQSTNMSLMAKYTKPIIQKNEIEIDCEHSENYAKMNLNTKNQKALMAFIIDTFDKYKIDIATAKILTIKNRAIDLFLIEKSGKFCLKKDEILDEIITI
jgi:[protein-PII] uridylyltransferase